MKVQSSNVEVQSDHIISSYEYQTTEVKKDGERYLAFPTKTQFQFKTKTVVPKLGVMFVGWGGNNGTTVTGGIIANKHKVVFNTKKGPEQSNFYGSITQCSTVKIGVNSESQEVYVPMRDVLPMVDPCEVVIGGWDISSMNLAEATARAQVFEYDLQQKLAPYLKELVPLPSILYNDFIASNQSDRTDNLLPGDNKLEHLNTIRKNIRDFKQNNNLDKVLVLWTANTERFCIEEAGVHDTTENLLRAVEQNHHEISPSIIFALATILEGCSYINGSPQNTLVPGVIELAAKQGVFVVGDDFKTGQTKIKTTIADFLIGAGIKSRSIVSYNHLGNNDGKNLSSEKQFRSKEITKRGCIDDILESNRVLYPTDEDLKIDHQIVIKYVPFTGDSKKAMDEYLSQIFMGGQHTFVLYNVCEDSLLAAPIIIDLFLLTELFERIEYKVLGQQENFLRFDTVLSWLGYLMKSPRTEEGINVVNALPRQKQMIENILKVCAGLSVDDNLRLDVRLLKQLRL